MITSVIFDFDGVIYDSTTYGFEAKRRYLEKFGVSFSIEGNSRLIGMSLRDQTAVINKEYGLRIDPEEFIHQTKATKEKLMSGNVKPNPGVKGLVDDLIKHGMKICIASTNRRGTITADLTTMGLEDKFKTMTCNEDVTKHKPDPEVFLVAAEKLGSKPDECVVIEDAMSGVEAAKKAGMKTIALLTKFNSRKDFKDADLIIDSMEELSYKKIMTL